MTNEERDEINRLSDLVGDAQKALKGLVDQSVCLANSPIIVTQTRWDEIFAAIRNARNQMDALQDKLEDVARQAGLPV